MTQIVGLSTELWLVLIVFLTCWPFAPFAPFLFSVLNVAVVVTVNSKVSVGLAWRVASMLWPSCPPMSVACLARKYPLSRFVVASQLTHVIRFASRGGTAKHLENDIFWFNRPSLLLHPVKMVSTVLAYACQTRRFGSNGRAGQRIAGAVPLLVPVVLACLLGLAVRCRQLLLHQHELAEALNCSPVLGNHPYPNQSPNPNPHMF